MTQQPFAASPVYQWHLPVPSDLPDVVGDLQESVLGIESTLSAELASRPKAATGTTNHTTVANGWTTKAVTFPAGRFTSPPVVVATPGGAPAVGSPSVGVGDITKDGCTLHIFHTAAVLVAFRWVAVGT